MYRNAAPSSRSWWRCFWSASLSVAAGAPLPRVDPTMRLGFAARRLRTMATSSHSRSNGESRKFRGVSWMTSTSSLGTTAITVQFDLNRNIDAAANDIQAAINAAGQLPKGSPVRRPQGQPLRHAHPHPLGSVRRRAGQAMQPNVLAHLVRRVPRAGGQVTGRAHPDRSRQTCRDGLQQPKDVRTEYGITTVDERARSSRKQTRPSRYTATSADDREAVE